MDVPRIGFLDDGDPGTDLMAALYDFDETGVRLHVPYLTHDDPRSRWWSSSFALHLDDPDRTRYRYEPPTELNYIDNRSRVGFVGCSRGRANQNIGLQVGRGTVDADYAIEKAHDATHYVQINGLRSEIDGMGYWLDYSTLVNNVKLPDTDGPIELKTTSRPVPALPLGRPLNLKAIAVGTQSGAGSAEVSFHNTVLIETFTTKPRAWEDHLHLHYAIRDLLRVAVWQPINFQSHQAASHHETRLVGNNLRSQWRQVRTATTGITDKMWKTNDQFLFSFSDIGTAGIARWLKLCKRFARGITPLVGMVELEGVTPDAALSQLGIAMEAIGYQTLIDSGYTPKEANDTRVASRVNQLLTETARHLSFDTTTFGQHFAGSYNSVKHANRTPVAPEIKLGHIYQGVELLRVWIALRLGQNPSNLPFHR